MKRWLGLVMVVGCGDDHHKLPANWPTTTEPARDSDPIAAACDKSKAKTGVLSEHLQIAGKNRHYTLVVPPAYKPGTSYPLVYVLHGDGGTGAQVRASFDLEGVAAGRALFLYPDAIGGGWDLDSPAGRNPDVAFFDAMLDKAQKTYCVDLRRIFVTGFSKGAYMANQLACRRGDRIRAVASHSGGGPYENGGSYDEQGHLLCEGKTVASLVIHGLADTTVMPSEGQKTVDHFTAANHCGGTIQTAANCVSYQGCAHSVNVCKIPGLGHALWPKAKQTIWKFFEAEN